MKGNVNRTVCATVLCTIIMVRKGTSSSYRWSTGSGFDLAWFSSLSSGHLTGHTQNHTTVILVEYIIIIIRWHAQR